MNINQTTLIDLQDPLEQTNIVYISLYDSDKEDTDINIAEDHNTKRQLNSFCSLSPEYETLNEEEHLDNKNIQFKHSEPDTTSECLTSKEHKSQNQATSSTTPNVDSAETIEQS